MMAPNADLRCTASQAMLDPYWQKSPEGESHRKCISFYSVHPFIVITKFPGKSLSVASSIVFEKDISKLMETSPPWSPPASGKENLSPPGLDPRKLPTGPTPSGGRQTITKARSQPKVLQPKGIVSFCHPMQLN
jgi:hypothetical protein